MVIPLHRPVGLLRRMGWSFIAAGVCLFFLAGAAFGGPIYRYLDEEGNTCFTDNPADKRYRYVPVKIEDPDGGTGTKEGAKAEEAKSKTEPGKPAGMPDAAEKERIDKKIGELESILRSTENERYREMLKSEIDSLNRQRKKFDPPGK